MDNANCLLFKSNVPEICRILPTLLSIWEEVVGPLNGLYDDEEGALVATVGTVPVILPIELADSLRPLVGQRIGLLRCDNVAKPYRIRVLG